MINALNSIKTVNVQQKPNNQSAPIIKASGLSQDTFVMSSKNASKPAFKASMSNRIVDDISSMLLTDSNIAKKELESLEKSLKLFRQAYDNISPTETSKMTHEALNGVLSLMQKDAEVTQSLFSLDECLKLFKLYLSDIDKFSDDYKDLLAPQKAQGPKVLSFVDKSNPNIKTMHSEFKMLMGQKPEDTYSLEYIKDYVPKFKQHLVDLESTIYNKYHDMHAQYNIKLEGLNAQVEELRKEIMGH